MLFKKRDARGGRRRVGLTAIGAGVVLVLVLVLSLTRPVVAWADSGPIQVYLTTKDLSVTLQRQADVSFGPKTSSADPRITVSPDTNRQKMVAGFGVAMTDTSAFLINGLPAGARDALMQALFSRAGDGIGLSFLRVPIGGTDFVVGGKPYTYDDNPPGGSDPTLSNFSIAHDQPYILPVINQALALNPQMKVMANAWTPPAWMKTDNKLVTTTGPLGTLKSQYYPVYAQYLVKFIQAYQAAGVHTDYLGVQNEPNTPLVFVAGIPESYLSAPDEGRLVRDQVAPALAAAGLSPAVIAFDDRYTNSQVWVPQYMAIARKQTQGIAYHCYLSDPSAMQVESKLYPEMLQLETECSSKVSNVYPQQMMIRTLRDGAQGIQLWNAALDPQGGPKIASCSGNLPPFAGQPCIGAATVKPDGTYALTSDFWALAHFSKFIQLGAVRVDSTTPATCNTPVPGSICGVEDVVYKNPDGGRVMVVTANDGRAHKFNVQVGNQQFSYQIPDGGTLTFVWGP